MSEETELQELISKSNASAFMWDEGKLRGNWGYPDETGWVRISESEVRATIQVWIRMLRKYGTQDVDSLIQLLINQKEYL